MKKIFLRSMIALTGVTGGIPQHLPAQEPLFNHRLLQHLAEQQVVNDPFFSEGIFPVYISGNKKYNEKRKDNTLFFTALIVYTLKTIRPLLPAPDQVLVDSIAGRAEKSADKFHNRSGRESYNFWLTDSSYLSPFSQLIRYKKKNMLADDPDCTSMCLLAFGAPVSNVQKAHTIMQAYVNNPKHPSPASPSRYKKYEAYSSWLSYRMPVVFDIGATCNILTLVQTYHLPWTKADSSSLAFIIACLQNKDYVRNPHRISPYYFRTPVILYHLARLMSIRQIARLESLKDELIDAALNQLEQTNNPLDKTLLTTALLKWGCTFRSTAPISPAAIEKTNQPFFVANISAFAPYFIHQALVKKELGIFAYNCPAYNDVLLLENLLLRKK